MTQYKLVPLDGTIEMCEAARAAAMVEYACPEDIGRAYVNAAPPAPEIKSHTVHKLRS